MNAVGAVLVAGIGNIFQGDDAFGVEVIKRLATQKLPDYVTLRDFGIRGFDLAYALMEPWDLVILVDAISRGGSPGTLYVIEPDESLNHSAAKEIDTHGMNPTRALDLVRTLGGTPPKMLVVGCEPVELGGEEGLMDLSPAVTASVEEAVRIVAERIALSAAVMHEVEEQR